MPCLDRAPGPRLPRADAARSRPTTTPVHPSARGSRSSGPSPPLLFRYSALTFNAHRIHYDRPYATGVEGYPDLVVQGPLDRHAALRACSSRAALPVRVFEFRARAPLFANRRFWLTGEPTGDGASLSAVRGDGVVAMTLDVTLDPP